MATSRLYSFRFPFDIQATLEPWRGALKNQFDEVVAHLADRDRALEDYVNLGMSQGRLNYAVSTSFASPITTEQDLPGLSVTVTVPANRVLRVTGQAIFDLTSTGQGFGWISQDGTHVAAFGELEQFIGAGTVEYVQTGSAILTPTAGTHTYKLTAERPAGVATFSVGGSATAPAFILVEDIGPVTS